MCGAADSRQYSTFCVTSNVAGIEVFCAYAAGLGARNGGHSLLIAKIQRNRRGILQSRKCESRRHQQDRGDGDKSSARHGKCQLTMRLSDAGLHKRQTKAVYLNHRLPLWLTEDATRDRSNRLLDDRTAY